MTDLELLFIKICTSCTIDSIMCANASVLWLYAANDSESKFARVFFSVGSVFFGVMPIMIVSNMEKRLISYLDNKYRE
jgi:hypothetical protein